MQYTNVNGYLLPNLLSTDTVRPIGRYGEMRRQFLENHRPDLLDRLLLEDRLNRHLSQVDEEARQAVQECYLLGRLPEKIPNHRPPHPAMREDLRHWEQIEAQLHLLERYSLQTREEVEQFITQKTEELQTLEARRTHCRNRLRRCHDPAECDALHTEKDQLTEKICAVRKELRTAQKIPPRADRMRERIELLNTQERQHAAYREER